MRMSRLAPALFPILALATGCSVGQGTGEVKSSALFAHDCWGTPPSATNAKAVGAPFDLQPDFFAADPYYYTSLQIRVQKGTDLEEVSDGLEVLVDDLNRIRAAITSPSSPDAGTYTGGTGGGGTGGGGTGGGATDGGVTDGGATDGGGTGGGTSSGTGGASAGGVQWRVALPAGVHGVGSSTVPPPDAAAAIVHMTLYLNHSCHNENVALYGLDGYITFSALFDGDPTETSADQKLTDATFNVMFGDPQDAPMGQYAGDVPAGLQSRVTGNFRFYFEQGQPAQPFP